MGNLVLAGDGASSKFGVYNFIQDLICEGKHARFVNSEGRFAVNWPRALECYEEYKSSKNPAKTKSRNINKRKASNGLRAALLNFYKKEGAKEFNECKKFNEKNEVIERQFQMPPRVFKTLFEDSQFTEDSEQDSSSLMSEVIIRRHIVTKPKYTAFITNSLLDLGILEMCIKEATSFVFRYQTHNIVLKNLTMHTFVKLCHFAN